MQLISGVPHARLLPELRYSPLRRCLGCLPLVLFFTQMLGCLFLHGRGQGGDRVSQPAYLSHRSQIRDKVTAAVSCGLWQTRYALERATRHPQALL